MSGGSPCTCPGTRKERMRNWFVSLRKANRSYFEAPQGIEHRSDYSTIMCRKCLMGRRSKAKFIDDLPDGE